MPLISSAYEPPYRIFRNGDASTLYAALLRKIKNVRQQRERLELSDGDFMDLDWTYCGKQTQTCIIVFHGLEGHAGRPYILGTAKIFSESGCDCCAPNYRSCSGEANRLFSSYHSGRTEDVQAVIEHVLSKGQYQNIILKGFSLGGNLVLKYTGENQFPHELKATIAISAPVDLEGCMYQLHKPRNFVYSTDFLLTLKQKLRNKQPDYPDRISENEIRKIKTLKAYDDYYTARANGFASALDYYQKSSSRRLLQEIRIPVLLINSANDPFLSESCYPREEAGKTENLFLEIPRYGGHVGFLDRNNVYYNEKRSVGFLREKGILLSTK